MTGIPITQLRHQIRIVIRHMATDMLRTTPG